MFVLGKLGHQNDNNEIFEVNLGRSTGLFFRNVQAAKDIRMNHFYESNHMIYTETAVTV